MLPSKFAPFLFGLILSGMMTFVVTFIATLRATGMTAEFGSLWMGSWASSWLVAFPLVLIFGPLTRKIVAKLVKQS